MWTNATTLTWSFSLWASIGITLNIGNSHINCLGIGLSSTDFVKFQDAPSKYKPFTKQPVGGRSETSAALTWGVTVVYNVERSRGQPFFLQAAWTRAVRYDSGICKPDNQITAGSPSFT